MSVVLEDSVEAAKVAVIRGVTKAYAQDGYVTEEGERDPVAVAEAAFTVVAAGEATHGEVVAQVFPSLPGVPKEWNAQPDPALAVKVYGEVRKQVGDLLKPDRSGKVQQLVGVRLPGFVLCKKKVGLDHVTAFYVTDDVGLITDDFAKPLNAAILRAHKTMGRNMAMIVDRKPEAATKWERLYNDASKSGLKEGHGPIKLAIEAARSNGADSHDGSAE